MPSSFNLAITLINEKEAQMIIERFPVLLTDRLRLRKPRGGDIPRIIEYANNSKIDEMTLSFSYLYQEKDAVWWLNRANRGFEDQSLYIFAICSLETD